MFEILQILLFVTFYHLFLVFLNILKGASVVKWLESLICNHLPLIAAGSDPPGTLDCFM